MAMRKDDREEVAHRDASQITRAVIIDDDAICKAPLSALPSCLLLSDRLMLILPLCPGFIHLCPCMLSVCLSVCASLSVYQPIRSEYNTLSTKSSTSFSLSSVLIGRRRR